MAFGYRVRDVRNELKLSQQKLADTIGVNQPVIGSIESRDSTNSKHAPQIAKALNVSLDWLLTGDGFEDAADAIANSELKVCKNVETYDESNPINSNEIKIFMYDLVDNDCSQDLVKMHSTLRLPKKLLDDLSVDASSVYAINYPNDDMQGHINEGSTIAVDTSKANAPINNNKIYLIKSGGIYMLRMLQVSFDGKNIEIRSSNKMYDTIELDREKFSNGVEIVGWVFWWSNFAKW